MTRQNHKRGFNLIEAAIVLGVVGLVVGGIWVAAANIRQNMKIDETYTKTMSAINKLMRLYPPRVVAGIAGAMPITENELLLMGVFPEEWRKTAGSFTFIKNPFGIMNVSGRSYLAGSIMIHRWRITAGNKQACVKLLIAFGKHVPHTIHSIDTDTTTGVTTPISPTVANTACSGSAQVTLNIKLL